MSPKINILPDTLINKIAAGEVVERPASVVKELIENSIDARSTEIFVDIIYAGRKLIRVSDNGEGMSRDDALTAFEKHATSKINKEADLFNITTLGFRGEALPSIASISRIKLITRPADTAGTLIEMEEGKVKKASETGAAAGTVIEVSDLFYNTPARLKFLKSDNTEMSHITAVINQQAIANPHIHFRLTNNKKELLNLSSTTDLYHRIYQIYGEDFMNNMLNISGEEDGVNIYGFVSKPSFNRAERNHIDIFLNKRYIKNNVITRAVYDAYSTLIPKDRHPLTLLFIDIQPSIVDVNVHPTKREVRFVNQTFVYDAVKKALKEGLLPSHRRADIPPVSYMVASPDADYGKQSGYAIEGARVMGQGAQGMAHGVAELSNQPIQLSQLTAHSVMPLGQIDNTYITADASGELWIIDQHAAYERLLYERLTQSYNSHAVQVQSLLIPEEVSLSTADAMMLKDYIDVLMDIGIEIEEFGRDAYIIRSVPSLLGTGSAKQMLLDIIDGLTGFQKGVMKSEVVDKIIMLIACHCSVRANHGLTYKEMSALIDDLINLKIYETCPHGRPIIIKFSKTDLEKMFKRR
jgi:DNA mismatch repair protein MutL